MCALVWIHINTFKCNKNESTVNRKVEYDNNRKHELKCFETLQQYDNSSNIKNGTIIYIYSRSVIVYLSFYE